ncbi:M23 family metallopeptidase [Dysgonomonas sp. 511]|uniref:M23 family metallopeptidase n=1 Tax=Dysgonomonas sp. 511 TaxID=2302930 RepID=UPI0013D70794|nr:M23 family metallopeptidase [Dysgonomonas sp. 511]NDV77759.1 M23 family peptidase [Dysgonomonas sp. 511]
MKRIITLLAILYAVTISAQEHKYRSPLDIPLILSANFGELRPNHFHTGVDLKTEGVINKPVYSIEDGYVSRISVSPSGYGLALYIDYPATGHTSVYGHLEKYAPEIAKYVKDKQYEQESFRVDLRLKPTEIPVKKGQLVAYSGNTGSSGGPHVHFEIRKTADDVALDPIEYYKMDIKDNRAPEIRAIAIFPLNEEGAVEFSRDIYRKNIPVLKNGNYAQWKDTVEVWGKIGFGVSAYDRMTGTANIYGVRKVRLYCDSVMIFSSDVSSVDFNRTRMINSMTDFDYWYRTKKFVEKSFVEPGNKLPIYTAANNGYLYINENRIYSLRYELEDLYGNKTQYPFFVKGREQTIPQKRRCTARMVWNNDNNYAADGFSINIPKDFLYDDLCFMLKKTEQKGYLSSVYSVNDSFVPLHNYCDMSIALKKDSIANKSQYGVVRLNAKGGYSWVGGKYENGKVTARIRELGHSYAITTDTKAPVITPVSPASWVKAREIKIRISDDKSGVASYKGTIDGKFVLFEKDVKSPFYRYKFDAARLTKGQKHKFVFIATDGCGNESKYEYEFRY